LDSRLDCPCFGADQQVLKGLLASGEVLLGELKALHLIALQNQLSHRPIILSGQ
jgi:hypothetical protein